MGLLWTLGKVIQGAYMENRGVGGRTSEYGGCNSEYGWL